MTEDWTAYRDRLAEIVLPLVYNSTVEGMGNNPVGVNELMKRFGLNTLEQLIAKQVYDVTDALMAERRKIFQAAIDQAAGIEPKGTL